MRSYFETKMSAERAHRERWREGLSTDEQSAYVRRYEEALERLERDGVHCAGMLRKAFERTAPEREGADAGQPGSFATSSTAASGGGLENAQNTRPVPGARPVPEARPPQGAGFTRPPHGELVFLAGPGRARRGAQMVAQLLGSHSRFAVVPIDARFHCDTDGMPDLIEGRVSLKRFLLKLREVVGRRRGRRTRPARRSRPAGSLRGGGRPLLRHLSRRPARFVPRAVRRPPRPARLSRGQAGAGRDERPEPPPRPDPRAAVPGRTLRARGPRRAGGGLPAGRDGLGAPGPARRDRLVGRARAPGRSRRARRGGWHELLARPRAASRAGPRRAAERRSRAAVRGAARVPGGSRTRPAHGPFSIAGSAPTIPPGGRGRTGCRPGSACACGESTSARSGHCSGRESTARRSSSKRTSDSKADGGSNPLEPDAGVRPQEDR